MSRLLHLAKRRLTQPHSGSRHTDTSSVSYAHTHRIIHYTGPVKAFAPEGPLLDCPGGLILLVAWASRVFRFRSAPFLFSGEVCRGFLCFLCLRLAPRCCCVGWSPGLLAVVPRRLSSCPRVSPPLAPCSRLAPRARVAAAVPPLLGALGASLPPPRCPSSLSVLPLGRGSRSALPAAAVRLLTPGG